MVEKIRKMVIWGDSVAKGVVYDDTRARYVLAKPPAAQIVAEQTGIEVINHARMGSTIEAGLEIQRHDIQSGLQADAAIIEFGGNDCDFDWRAISEAPDARHLPKTPLALFEQKLREMIALAREASMQPLLLTLPPINADRYFDFISKDGLSRDNILRWLGDKNHIYRFHEQYSGLISRVARECSCRLLDVRAAFLSEWRTMDMLCHDGIHPTPDGQRLIGNYILSTL